MNPNHNNIVQGVVVQAGNNNNAPLGVAVSSPTRNQQQQQHHQAHHHHHHHQAHHHHHQAHHHHHHHHHHLHHQASRASAALSHLIPQKQQQQQQRIPAALLIQKENKIFLRDASSFSNQAEMAQSESDGGDDAYQLDYDDGDVVRLINPAVGFKALDFPVTIETATQQHISIVMQHLKQHFAEQQQKQQQQQIDPNVFYSHIETPKNVVGFYVNNQNNKNNNNDNNDNNNSDTSDTGRIRIHWNSLVDLKGGKFAWALFEPEKTRSGIRFRCIGHLSPPLQPHYLSATVVSSSSSPSSGKNNNEQQEVILSASTDPNDENNFWMLQPFHQGINRQLLMTFQENINFTPAEFQQFHQQGFIIVKNVCSPEQTEAALRYLNHLLSHPSCWVLDEERNKNLPHGEKPHYTLEPSSHRSILALFRGTKLFTLTQRLLGRKNIDAVRGGQLALRFPIIDTYNPEFNIGTEANARNKSQSDFHIDGQDKPHSLQCLPFSLLVKVALSDQSRDNMGNFTVFPGSHRRRDVVSWFHNVTMNMPSTSTHMEINQNRPSLDDIKPLQVQLSPGDAAIVHPYLCHRVGTNVSSSIRYSTIFRVHGKNIEEFRQQPSKLLNDPNCFLLSS